MEYDYEQLYPKARWHGRPYRIQKPLGNDMVRLITMDGKGIVDVPKSEVVTDKSDDSSFERYQTKETS